MKYNTIKKQSRTISGVTPVAVMTQPRACPGNCVYCPTYSDIPQSYTPTSPAVLRAINCEYDPAKQVELRLSILRGMGHPIDKIELIVMGGTFLSAPKEYQHDFIKRCFDALNGQKSASLEEAHRLNEKVESRCVGLCIETRPDYCTPADIEWMVKMGATRVELGVQAIDDEIYLLTRRGHTVADVVSATHDLKMSGIKVHYHWMPNLPGVTRERELELFRRLFTDERFCPDGLKLYPTMVVAGTELERWKEQGFYKPCEEDDLIDLVAELKSIVPIYARISRVLRDIPSVYITGGPKDSLRDIVQNRLAERGQRCNCIRCREHGRRVRQGWEIGEASLKRMDYKASGGQEIFLSFEDEQQTLFGLLRLRLQDSRPQAFGGGKGVFALVREIHVYGSELAIGERDDVSAQHKGFGKKLLAEAERIASSEYGAQEMFILSGVGARPYYRSLGYSLENNYMYRVLTTG